MALPRKHQVTQPFHGPCHVMGLAASGEKAPSRPGTPGIIHVMTSSTSRLADAARPLHDRLRRSVAVALRDRVAGEDNAAKAAVIWDKPGERWFTESDP